MASSQHNTNARQFLERARPLLGTLVSIRVQTNTPAAEAAIEQAFARIAGIHAAMSFHEQDSELSRLNCTAFIKPHYVSRDLHRVLLAAIALAKASGGKFDPTVAKHLMQWGHLPSHHDEKYEALGNWRDIQCLPNASIKFGRPLLIDLGGIAKGYAVDEAIRILKKCGIQTGVVNAGGDMRTFGCMETIYARDPAHPQKSIPVLQVRDAAVASSAGYFSEHNGHTALVNPHNGQSMGHDISVTVVARRAIWADALTKIVMVSAADSIAVLQRLQASALILHKDGTRHKVN
jgi:FAD:protein FMN transferase